MFFNCIHSILHKVSTFNVHCVKTSSTTIKKIWRHFDIIMHDSKHIGYIYPDKLSYLFICYLMISVLLVYVFAMPVGETSLKLVVGLNAWESG